MYPLFRDVSDPYQHTLWLKYVLYTHIIAFIIKSNWKLPQNLHTWTTQYVHFQCGIYWPKPVVLASSSTSIHSKWNLLSEFFIFYTKSLPSSFAHTFLLLSLLRDSSSLARFWTVFHRVVSLEVIRRWKRHKAGAPWN
jgi:hypothetical protein